MPLHFDAPPPRPEHAHAPLRRCLHHEAGSLAFRAHSKSEWEATDKAGLKAWEKWGKRNAAAIVATDVMVGKTRRVPALYAASV